jgi:FMN phosphatase YigB (HAD superfamily)
MASLNTEVASSTERKPIMGRLPGLGKRAAMRTGPGRTLGRWRQCGPAWWTYTRRSSPNDFRARFRAIAVLARVDPDDLRRNQQQYRAELDTGALSTAGAFSRSLAARGVSPTRELLAAVADPRHVTASCRLYDNALPFLNMLRSLGVSIALVSNCPDNTRAMLADLGLTALATM